MGIGGRGWQYIGGCVWKGVQSFCIIWLHYELNHIVSDIRICFLSILELHSRQKLFFQNAVLLQAKLYTQIIYTPTQLFSSDMKSYQHYSLVFMVDSAYIKNCLHSFFSEHKEMFVLYFLLTLKNVRTVFLADIKNYVHFSLCQHEELFVGYFVLT